MTRIIKEGIYQWKSSRFIGEGSFGKVYKGKNTQNKQIVAVKVLDLRHFSSKDMNSLRNEIQIMKCLDSPYVVRMLDCFSNPTETYIFMEFCEGGDLRSYINSQGGMLQEKLAINVLHQVMLGLKEVYMKGYMHRDIKPENILIQKNTFKIADFGFATKIHPRGRQLLKEYVGTPLYMSPQILENNPYTNKSDVWSIGMTFFEMLFGKTPWPARDINSFLTNIKNVPLRFPYDKPIGKQTKDFITKCLMINEEKRMSWEEMFNHPIVKLGGGEIQKPEVVIDEKVKKILRSMQEEVQSKNLNIVKIFEKFDQDQGGTLDEVEFLNFLRSVDSRIGQDESSEVFLIVDISHDKKISLQEFGAIFCHYDFANIEDQASSIIQDLKEIVKANDINLEQIFLNFDKDKSGTLDKNQFTQLLRIVAPALKIYEIEKCFEKFDKDSDKQISFLEFKQQLTSGIPFKDFEKQDVLKLKAKQIITELRRILKQNNIDIKVMFKNFNKSKDGFLDCYQFQKLIFILDKNINNEELTYIFKLFDLDQDSKISFQEFSQYLS